MGEGLWEDTVVNSVHCSYTIATRLLGYHVTIRTVDTSVLGQHRGDVTLIVPNHGVCVDYVMPCHLGLKSRQIRCLETLVAHDALPRCLYLGPHPNGMYPNRDHALGHAMMFYASSLGMLHY